MSHVEISSTFTNESRRAKPVGSMGPRQDIIATVSFSRQRFVSWPPMGYPTMQSQKDSTLHDQRCFSGEADSRNKVPRVLPGMQSVGLLIEDLKMKKSGPLLRRHCTQRLRTPPIGAQGLWRRLKGYVGAQWLGFGKRMVSNLTG